MTPPTWRHAHLLHRSPAMEIASRDALSQAGIGIDDVEHLDLYSCFASSVLFATDALGIDPLGDRDLTVTGGLPYHGGPASNYTTHAIAETVHRLRGMSGSYGLVSGVGMHMTKHVWAVYGSDPGALQTPDYDEVQRKIDADPAVRWSSRCPLRHGRRSPPPPCHLRQVGRSGVGADHR